MRLLCFSLKVAEVSLSESGHLVLHPLTAHRQYEFSLSGELAVGLAVYILDRLFDVCHSHNGTATSV